MTTCAFAVDKQRSLEIIRQISKKDEGFVVNRLNYIELFLINQMKYDGQEVNPNDANKPNSQSNIEDFYDQIISESNKDDDGYDSFAIEDDAQLYFEDNQLIMFKEDDPNICFKNDYKYTFIYNDELQSWVVKDDSSPNGIDHHGCVRFLDFRNYTE